MSTNPLVLAEISDGFTFRNIIEYLKTTVSDGNIRFKKNRICIKRKDPLDKVYVEVELDTEAMGNYEFNSTLEHIVFGVDFPKVRNVTNSIGKKESFRLWLPDQKTMNMQWLSNQKSITSSGSNSIVTFVNKEIDDDHDVVIDDIYPEKPNCVIMSNEFSDMCKSICSLKSKEIIITGFPQGIIFEACSGTEITKSRHKFGDCSLSLDEKPRFSPSINKLKKLDINYDTNKEIIKITISINNLKALSKKNFGPNSSLHFFMVKEGPIKIVARGGSYATIKTYLSH